MAAHLAKVRREGWGMGLPTSKILNVRLVATSDPLTPSGSQGWAYSKTTGEFIINHASYSSW